MNPLITLCCFISICFNELMRMLPFKFLLMLSLFSLVICTTTPFIQLPFSSVLINRKASFYTCSFKKQSYKIDTPCHPAQNVLHDPKVNVLIKRNVFKTVFKKNFYFRNSMIGFHVLNHLIFCMLQIKAPTMK